MNHLLINHAVADIVRIEVVREVVDEEAAFEPRDIGLIERPDRVVVKRVQAVRESGLRILIILRIQIADILGPGFGFQLQYLLGRQHARLFDVPAHRSDIAGMPNQRTRHEWPQDRRGILLIFASLDHRAIDDGFANGIDCADRFKFPFEVRLLGIFQCPLDGETVQLHRDPHRVDHSDDCGTVWLRHTLGPGAHRPGFRLGKAQRLG
ncbi:hypothetical protein BUUB107078_34295 [Burkholderia ubonensis]